MKVSFSPYLCKVAIVFSVRFSGRLWFFWSQGIGRDYNEILHWPSKAQLIAFAKKGIHLPGRRSHTLYVSASSFSPAGEKLLWVRKKSCTWKTDCSDLLFRYLAVSFGIADIFSKLSSVIICVGTAPIFWETFAVLHRPESLNYSFIYTLVYFKSSVRGHVLCLKPTMRILSYQMLVQRYSRFLPKSSSSKQVIWYLFVNSFPETKGNAC